MWNFLDLSPNDHPLHHPRYILGWNRHLHRLGDSFPGIAGQLIFLGVAISYGSKGLRQTHRYLTQFKPIVMMTSTTKISHRV